MTYRLQEHPEAEGELAEASDWYDAQRPGLGHSFLDAAFRAQDDIAERPETWTVFPGWDEEPVVRSRHFRGFPYRAVYYLKDSEDDESERPERSEQDKESDKLIVVIAYAHEKRRPAYWAHRIQDPF